MFVGLAELQREAQLQRIDDRLRYAWQTLTGLQHIALYGVNSLVGGHVDRQARLGGPAFDAVGLTSSSIGAPVHCPFGRDEAKVETRARKMLE